jgi:predicted DNA-binding transcriptional regulator YafY
MATETNYQRGDKFIRLLTVFDMLQSSPHGRTTREIADSLGANIRNVQRDIEQMERAGLDIQRDEQNRVTIGATSKLPPLQFTKREGVTVLIALRLLQQMRTTRDDALVGALGRMAAAMQVKPVTAYLGAMLEAAAGLPEGGVREQLEIVVVECFVNRVPCEIEYENYDGEISKRVIRPYFLEPRPESRTICAYSFDEKTQSMRWFRVDRMRAAHAVLIGGTYAVPDDFDISAVTRASWSIWQAGDELEEVILHYEPAVAPRIRETTWHASAETTDLPGGGLELRLQVASEIEMRPWVLGWGSQVTVISPPSLREFVAQSMRDGARKYDSQVSSG